MSTETEQEQPCRQQHGASPLVSTACRPDGLPQLLQGQTKRVLCAFADIPTFSQVGHCLVTLEGGYGKLLRTCAWPANAMPAEWVAVGASASALSVHNRSTPRVYVAIAAWPR
jgi:hypothetical protein